MESSIGAGYMAVFAVSGSVVLLALRLHNRLLSNFFKQMEFELGSTKSQVKKKARSIVAMAQTQPGDKAHRKMHRPPKLVASGKRRWPEEKIDSLPLNWQVLYKGIIEYKNSAHIGHN